MLTALLTELDIKHVIAHGNLIEFERAGRPNYHDDDLDIRFDVADFDKWERFCATFLLNATFYPRYRALHFDDRLANATQQRLTAIQVRLQRTKTTLGAAPGSLASLSHSVAMGIEGMDIHADDVHLEALYGHLCWVLWCPVCTGKYYLNDDEFHGRRDVICPTAGCVFSGTFDFSDLLDKCA